MATHDTPGKVRLRLRVPSGVVQIVTEETDQTTIDVSPRRHDEATRQALDEMRESLRKVSWDEYEVRLEIPTLGRRWGIIGVGRKFDVRVTAPEDADVDVETVSTDIFGRGSFGSVTARTTSGGIEFDDVNGAGEFRTVSGGIEVAVIRNRGRAQTVSGDITIRATDDELVARSVSGDIGIDSLGRDARLTSISGDVDIGVASTGEINVKTTSGDTEIGVQRGVGVWLDIASLSGNTTSMLEDGEGGRSEADLEIRVMSVSGDVTLRPSAVAEVDA